MIQRFSVQGMSCAACVARVEKAVGSLSGVDSVSVNLLANSMTVDYDDKVVNEDRIIAEVERVGYTAAAKGKPPPSSKESSCTVKSVKTRLILSAVFLILLMSITMGPMLFSYPLPSFLSGHENAMTGALVQLFLSLPVLYLNRSYFENGFKALFKGSANMDSLIALGASASVIYGIATLFKMSACLSRGDVAALVDFHDDLYFEGAAMIVTLVTVGKLLEEKSKKKTGEALSRLADMTPKTARVEREGAVAVVEIDEVIAGDVILIKAGEAIPVDAVVLQGEGEVDESAITGESLPSTKTEESKIIGATILKSGYLRARVTHTGENTVFAKIIELVENAQSSKAPIARLADKIAGIFVPVVIVISIVTCVVWLSVGESVGMALTHAISVLVISCPCALGLATPVAITVGTGKGAESGILIKSAEILEALYRVDTVVLDKTGTITSGKPEVVGVFPTGCDMDKLLVLAASLEEKSEHPLSRAILSYTDNNNVLPDGVMEYKTVSGKGISALWRGKAAFAGNAVFLNENSIDISAGIDFAANCAIEGKTPLFFAHDGVLCGVIAVADTIKEDSREAIELLSKYKKKVIMLTGDNKRTSEGIGKSLALSEIISDVLPEDKENVIRKLQQSGHRVAMVGDGINDAPALARADVGFSVGSGTDIARDSADVVLMNDSLVGIYDALRLSHEVIRNIKQNLFWAFFYNCLGIPLAAGVFVNLTGWTLNPMFASAAMSVSSLFVVTNALRLKKFKRTKITNKEKKEKKSMTITIEGMMCNHCKAHVEKALSAVAGVEKFEVNLENKCAVVEGSADKTAFVRAIEDAGYKVVEIKD